MASERGNHDKHLKQFFSERAGMISRCCEKNIPLLILCQNYQSHNNMLLNIATRQCEQNKSTESTGWSVVLIFVNEGQTGGCINCI